MQTTVSEKIIAYLFANRGRWISKIELENQRRRFKCLAETLGRKARRVHSTHPNIIKRYVDGIVEYKYKL
jgi:hypothetical protein